ncbi:MAG: hypothetical protein IPK26_19525 [Planctomycetes bacterium]|nr:hypothetical protein [Planctomycetota bacterium]
MWKPLSLGLGLLLATPHEVIAAPAGGDLAQHPPAAATHHRLAMRHVGARSVGTVRPEVQVVEVSASRGKATARPAVLRRMRVRR